MTSIDAYLPVPTMRRDENSLPPITRFVSLMVPSSPLLSAAAHRSDDLHPVAVAQHGCRVLALRRHITIHGHRGVLAGHAEVVQEPGGADRVGDSHVLADGRALHKQKRPRPCTGAAADRRRVPFCGITPFRSEGCRPAP